MKWMLAFLLALTAPAFADEGPIYGPQLEGYTYPFAVRHYRFTSQGVAMDMAYMDAAAAKPNGKTIVLLHGKNFCAATWQGSIQALTQVGYRVIAPDQIGWCKSTKPEHYQFTFEQLAANTNALLKSLNISRAIIMGHSTGGMLAVRYGLLYPADTEQLVLVDPLGLEDWRAKGVPWQSVDAQYKVQLNTTAATIRDYERATYYANTWKPEYELWVQMLAGMYRGPGHDIVAWNSALTYDMIYTQPVFYEFEKLTMPVLLMIGDHDTTAPGKQLAPPELRATLGNYPVLAKAAVARMPHGKLIEFPDLGHSPQIQDPAAFHKALLEALKP
ncbi:MAG TPA: alpha/beta hydrolase [Rhizomicrobium sp.]|jgi:pimeloyl-ACP methyl ester carboxylesterase